MFFNGWSGLWRTFIVGILAYIALVLILRISGKRTLSKMNAFDLVVTIAIGSTLATIMLSKRVALLEGVLALALLVFLQFLISWSMLRFKVIKRVVKSEPRLLYYNGKFLEQAISDERILKEEVLQSVRNQGIAFLDDVQSVVLETDGSLSIIKNSDIKSSSKNKSSLINIEKTESMKDINEY